MNVKYRTWRGHEEESELSDLVASALRRGDTDRDDITSITDSIGRLLERLVEYNIITLREVNEIAGTSIYE